ncbi:synaptotagmin-7-like [Dendronephthya gigantea]|uniref:synaptotagmin-7-like n=1 Tax=Dendronephthya gigantea TaxID=151771 RepID=UPI001069E36B|nr:synaptotagmin-7-like [Dendronephthya gigantea]
MLIATVDTSLKANEGHGVLGVEHVIILFASAISLVSVVTVCGWCRRLFQKSGNNNGSYDESIVDSLKNQTPAGRNLSLVRSSPSLSSSDDSVSRLSSPGHGRRTIRFPSPPEVGVDVLAIQPEKHRPADIIIPPEPALPDPTRKEYLGQIFFSLKYDSQTMTLGVKIMKATKLPAKDFSGTSDPFVKICLLPDKKHKMETRVKRKNLNPVWNEYFMFEGFPYNKLMQRTLCLQVLDYDRFSRNDPIGDVRLSLENLNLGPEPIVLSKELQPSSKAEYLGDLLLSMCYQPTANRINILVMKAARLKAMDITGKTDPYVKIYFMQGGKRIEKKKTTIKKRNRDPVWNESFIFNVSVEKLRDTSFNFIVMDYDRITQNEAIGQVTLSYRSTGASLHHWTEMMNNPRRPIAKWHKIQEV